MAMTLSQMRAEVRANIKRESSGMADSRLNTFINWGQALIADWKTYEEMRKIYTGATADGQKRYGFPTNMKDIYSLRLISGADSRKLIYVNPRDFDTLVPRPEQATEGKSDYYVDYGTIFEVYRIPDASYTLELRCSLYPTDLSADSSTSELLRKDSLICALATMFGFLTLKEIEDANYWKNEVAAPLFQASIASDHDANDWVPIARPFTIQSPIYGDYVSNPLVHNMP